MPTPDLDTFASRMRGTRVSRGMSQGELAELLGMQHPQINRYECGRATPRTRILDQIAAVLNVRAEWLLTGTEPRHIPANEIEAAPPRIAPTPLLDSGIEISFVLYGELRLVFAERAARESLSLDAYLTAAMSKLGEDLIDDYGQLPLASRVKALIDAGAV